MTYVKLVNNKLVYISKPLKVNGFDIYNPTIEQIKEAGYKELIRYNINNLNTQIYDSTFTYEETDTSIIEKYEYILNTTKLKTYYTNIVQKLLDDTARERGYDGILSACSYVNSSDNIFASESRLCITWRDQVWRTCYNLLSEVESGIRDIPDQDTFISLLPSINWNTL